MKIHNFAELKAEKEGKITPLALAKWMVEQLESGQMTAKHLSYVLLDEDEIIRAGWTDASHVKLVGMLDCAKDIVKDDMEDVD